MQRITGDQHLGDMDTNDLSYFTIYHDLMTVLKERGFSNSESTEIFLKLTAQAEMEVVEEMMGRLSEKQLQILENFPENTSSLEIAKVLELNAEEIDLIRAENTAKLIEKIIPTLDN